MNARRPALYLYLSLLEVARASTAPQTRQTLPVYHSWTREPTMMRVAMYGTKHPHCSSVAQALQDCADIEFVGGKREPLTAAQTSLAKAAGRADVAPSLRCRSCTTGVSGCLARLPWHAGPCPPPCVLVSSAIHRWSVPLSLPIPCASVRAGSGTDHESPRQRTVVCCPCWDTVV